MRVVHRGPEISVAHRLLDLHRIAAGRKPGGHPAVPKVVLVEIRRQLGPLDGVLERPPEDPDPLASLCPAARRGVMEHSGRPLAVIGGEPEAGEMLAHGSPELRRHGDPPTLAALRPMPISTARDPQEAFLEVHVLPLEMQGLGVAPDPRLAERGDPRL